MTSPTPDATRTGTGASPEVVDAVIVGAGLAGLYAIHRLRQIGLTVCAFEVGDDVGGTWYWNRYPGARCDIESLWYSYSFSEELQQEWEWTEKYATQPEILRYINHVTDRFDLRRHIRFGTRVTAARFDERANRWLVTTDRNDRLSARFCILATGILSAPKPLEFPGLEDYGGQWYHTARWPHDDVSFEGQRVGVIGTGSSGVQCIPILAAEAEHLTVFQRTPNFSLPARNSRLEAANVERVKASYAEQRRIARESELGIPVHEVATKRALDVTPEERRATYEERWQRSSLVSFSNVYVDLLRDKGANDTVAEFLRSKIRDVVEDPQRAEALSPRAHPFGTKRTCLDTNYFMTFNQPHVDLVDVKAAPILRVTPRGILTAAREYELDSLVFATGFDAMTGAVLAIDIRGRHNLALRDKWATGPAAYLGLCPAAFPNLFIITGPGSPSALSNMIVSIEQHVDWLTRCILFMGEHRYEAIDATTEAEDQWVRHVEELANQTLYPLATSWYMGANIPGKPRVFMSYVGGVDAYRQACDEIAAAGYRGFTFTASRHRERSVASSSRDLGARRAQDRSRDEA